MRFSVSNWEHLYSLEQAIVRTQQANGKRLKITGMIRNEPRLDNQDTPITLTFYGVDGDPPYRTGAHQQIILGQIRRGSEGLVSELPVDDKVFEEMRRNLMEYADIDGIHIIVSIGLNLPDDGWPRDRALDILKLDYAMRGDA